MTEETNIVPETCPDADDGEAKVRGHRRKDRELAIIAAAMDEFCAAGLTNARLDDIAARAGVAKGTLYLYFENKEELFKAIVREHLVPAIQRAEERAETHGGSSRELLRELVHSRWDMMVHSPLSGVPKLVLSEAGQFPDLVRYFHDEIIVRSHALFARVLRTGVERGEFRNLDVDYVTKALMAPLIVAALWKHSIQPYITQRMDTEKYFDTSLDMLLDGLAAPAAGGTSR